MASKSDSTVFSFLFSVLLWPIALALLGLSTIASPVYGLALPRLVRSSRLLLLLELIGSAYLWYAAIAGVIFVALWCFVSRPLRRPAFWVLAVAVGVFASTALSWYLPRAQAETASGTSVVAMAYNVNYQLWDTQSVTDIVREHPADILGLIEPLTTDAAELRERVRDLYPHYYRATGGNLSLLSRYPILSATTDTLGTSVSSLIADLDVDGRQLRVIATHPPPPVAGRFFRRRNQTIAALADYARQYEGPLVVMGDFNATSWSIYLQNFVRRSGMRNASAGRGLKPTWFYNEAGRPLSRGGRMAQLLKIPIDHIFASPDIRVERVRTAPAGVSDHRPIIAKLRLPA